VRLCEPEQVDGQLLGGADALGDLVEERDLVEEPRVDPGARVDLLDGEAAAQVSTVL
jgi:hypothetical protein